MPALAVRLLRMLVIAAVAALLSVALPTALVAGAVAAFTIARLAVPLLLAGAAVMLLRRPLGRARLRALAGGGDRHPDQLLDVAQERQLVVRAQRDGDAVGAGARGAADAVHVAFRDVGQVEVDDVADALDVDAAGGDVGRHQRPDPAVAEAFQHTLTLVLRLVAVDRFGGDAILVEAADHLVGAV